MVAVLIGVTALWYGGSPPEITAAISVVTWWAIALGLAFDLIPVSKLARGALIPVALLASLAVLTGLSFFWTNNEGHAFEQIVQLICILGLFSISLLCSAPGSAMSWLRGMAIGLTFLVLLAALSRFFPDIGTDSELRDSLYGSAGRLSWPLGYWNAMAAVTAMATVLVSWFAATLEDVRWRIGCVALLPTFFLVQYLTSSRGAVVALILSVALLLYMERRRKGLAIAYGAGLAGGAIIVAVAAQMSDLVHADLGATARIEGISLLVLTAAVTAGVVLLLKKYESTLRARPIPRPTKAVWIGIGIVALIGLIAFNPIKQTDSFVATPEIDKESAVNTNRTTVHLLSTGGNGRWQYWSAAVEAFKDEPLYGIGAGGFRDYYTSHRETLLFGHHPHSLPLGFAAELGLIGFLLAAGFLFSVLWVGWKRWRTDFGVPAPEGELSKSHESPYLTEAIPPFAAIILTGMVTMSLDWTSQFPVVAAPILISAAVLVGPATRKARVSDAEAVTTPSGRLAPRELPAVLAIIFSGVAILLSVYGFGISSQIESSQRALREGAYEKAINEGEDAVGLAPWSEAALLQLAAAQELSGNDIAALNTLDRAVGQAPLDSAPWLAKLRIANRLNDDEEVRRSLIKALRLDPHAPFFEFEPAP